MTSSARVLLILLILCGCVGCDQATKAIAREYIPQGTSISLFHDTLRLERTENVGAFLSLGDSMPRPLRDLVFTLGGLLIVTVGVIWTVLRREMTAAQTVAAMLACAGGLGNVIDRLSRAGHVTDFLNVGVGPIRTGVCNVADVALMLGLALLLVSGARRESVRG